MTSGSATCSYTPTNSLREATLIDPNGNRLRLRRDDHVVAAQTGMDFEVFFARIVENIFVGKSGNDIAAEGPQA